MGRNKGTNDYSNNFEPQVTGLLDARTRVDTKADLLLASTWASTDGNVYLPKGIRVSVTDDTTAANNGVYMLMADDYTVASNWMKIGQNGGGGSKPIYLTTDGLLDATTDTNLSTTDIEQLSRLFNLSDEVPNIKYAGIDASGVTKTHVEMNVAFTTISEPLIVMFIHPISGDGMVMQINVERGIATAPVAMGYMDSGSGGSSNIKILTTPELVNPSRTSTISFNPTDISIIQNLTRKDFLMSASVPSSASSNFIMNIPLTINRIGTNETITGVLTYVVNGSMYMIPFTITSSGSSVNAPQKVSSSGGSSSSNVKVLTTPDLLNIQRTGTIDLNAADIQIINNLSASDILVYVWTNDIGTITYRVPVSFNMANSGNLGIYLGSVILGGSIYTFTINKNTSGTVTATKLTLQGSSGGSGEAAYVTTLNLQSTITGDLLSQAEYDEIINIHNKWKQGIPVIATVGSYRGILNINGPTTTITNNSTISFSIIYNSTIETWSTQMTVDSSQWTREYPEIPLAIDLYDIYELGTFTAEVNTTLHDAFKKLDEYYSAGRLIYANAFWSYYGNFNIDRDDEEMAIYVNYQNRKYKIKYDSQADGSYTYTVADVTPYNLNLEVRIKGNQVEFKVNEIVPNGYICLYRKKRCTCSKLQKPNRTKQNKYTIPYFYFPKRPGRLQVEGLRRTVIPTDAFQPNVWNVLPIPSDMLASQDSTSIRFKGNVHAKPCELTSTTGTALNKKTAVLNLGLAYNVINPNYINGYKENNAIPNDIVRAGNMVKFKARLNCLDITNINSGYQIIYTMD